MPLYEYKAVTSDGRHVEGVYEGKDKSEIISKLNRYQ